MVDLEFFLRSSGHLKICSGCKSNKHTCFALSSKVGTINSNFDFLFFFVRKTSGHKLLSKIQHYTITMCLNEVALCSGTTWSNGYTTKIFLLSISYKINTVFKKFNSKWQKTSDSVLLKNWSVENYRFEF